MCNHGCPENPMLFAPRPEIGDAQLRIGNEPAKASIGVDGDILVDAAVWSRARQSEKDFLIYHELAHMQKTGCANSCEEKPNGCERCADARAGACMADAGYTLRQTLDAVKGLRFTSRKTGVTDAEYGYNQMKRAGADRRGANYTMPSLNPKPDPVIASPAPPDKDRTVPGATGGVVIKQPGTGPQRGTIPNRPDTGDSPPAPGSCVCAPWDWVVGVFGAVTLVVIGVYCMVGDSE